ncbi:MAG: DUF1273 family protein [Clostridia bacterium]|nr:DUF1273 family protein [Clostridia bacterium]
MFTSEQIFDHYWLQLNLFYAIMCIKIDRNTGQNREVYMICCVTGHRPSSFPFPCGEEEPLFLTYRRKLLTNVNELIHFGYDTFITGMAEGADIDFALTVLYLKKSYEHIRLEAALPCPIYHPKKSSPYDRQRGSILERCDRIHLISDHYYRGCMDQRNRFMVDQANMVYAIWSGSRKGGTWNTIKYAQRCEKEIRYLMLTEFVDSEAKK